MLWSLSHLSASSYLWMGPHRTHELLLKSRQKLQDATSPWEDTNTAMEKVCIYSGSQLRGVLCHCSEVKAIGEKRHGTRVGDLLVTSHLYSGRREKAGNMVIIKPHPPPVTHFLPVVPRQWHYWGSRYMGLWGTVHMQATINHWATLLLQHTLK